MCRTMYAVDTALKHVLVESQELLYPEDLIERDPDPDFTFIFSKVRKVYTICGLRRVGKTYYLYQIRKKLIEKGIPARKTFYINMEDERIPKKTEVLSRLIPLIKELFGVRDEIYLLIDEIQHIPNWSAWARRIHDARKAILFLSGSTSSLSSENIPRELRGRSTSTRLLPLTFMDFLLFRNVKIDRRYLEWSEDQLSILKNYLNEYLKYGGMPEVVLAPKYKKITIAQDYFKTIISRDITDQFNIENKIALEDLLKLLINSPTFSISKTYNILKSIGHRIGKETIRKYVNYANKVFFIDPIYIFSRNIKDQLMYPRKIYVADNIFISALGTKYDMGRLLENLVYIELKRITQRNPLIKIHYWRGKSGEEVDFIIVKGTQVTKLIQVSWDPIEHESKRREIKGLIKAGKEFKKNEGIIITYNYEEQEKVNGFKIEFIPIWKILMRMREII